ncbi:hypothetical protein OROGR_030402 [Orobanche gracilis]
MDNSSAKESRLLRINAMRSKRTTEQTNFSQQHSTSCVVDASIPDNGTSSGIIQLNNDQFRGSTKKSKNICSTFQICNDVQTED